MLSYTRVELVRGLYHDIVLWMFYTDKMDDDLGDTLVHLTFLAASDGNRGVYVDRIAGVSRMFLAALHGIAEAKMAVTELPSIPHVASESEDYSTRIKSFLALCD